MIKIFSFFSGIGLLDLGFEKAGYEIVFANELSKSFLNGYKYAREKLNSEIPKPVYYEGSIDTLVHGKDAKLISIRIQKIKNDNEIVGFIGGPPCPDFSVGGKNRGRHGDNGKLSLSYFETILKFQPDFFLFENVKGLWRTKVHREFYDELKQMAESKDYILEEKLINVIEYGVPQDRERIILLGFKKRILESKNIQHPENKVNFDWNRYTVYPNKKAFNINWPETNSFEENGKIDIPKDVIKELTVQYWFKKNEVDNHPNGKNIFKPRNGLKRFLTVDEGDVSKKSYKRLHRWRYSPTAAYGNNEVHLHPFLPRRISVAEVMAIQSLPKKFELPQVMSLTDMFKALGNGVPFLAARSIAKTIKDFLKE